MHHNNNQDFTWSDPEIRKYLDPSRHVINRQNWIRQLLKKYNQEWKGREGDSQKINEFLIQNEHQPDFLMGLIQFKKYLHRIDNPLRRTVRLSLFLDAYYVKYHPEFKKLNDNVDSLLNKYTSTSFSFSNLFSMASATMYAVSQFMINQPASAAAIFLGFASFIHVSAQEMKATQASLTSAEITQMQINATCSHKSFIAANKPYLRFTKKDQDMFPLSCIDYVLFHKPMTVACIADREKISDFNKRNPHKNIVDKIDQERIKFEKEKTIALEAEEFIDSHHIQLTQEQREIYRHYVGLLDELRRLKYQASIAEKLNAGKCSEHAAYNAFSIFKINQEQNTFTKIQLVRVKDQDYRFITHEYLLVDSVAKDVLIVNNPVEAENYFSSIQTGYVCDSWNEGVFEKVTENINDIYRKWSSVEVKTLSNYFDLTQLPEPLAEFMEIKLDDLGFYHLLRQPIYSKLEL